MKTKTIELFEYDELNESAKEVALAWYANGCLDYEWWEYTYDDAARIGLEITSFDLDRNRHAKGHLTTGVYDVISAIQKEHGKDCDTFKLAEEYRSGFDTLDQALNSCATQQDYEDLEYSREADREEMEANFKNSLLEEYSIMLQKEYEYRTSREVLEESIRVNEYTFRENGKRED